MAAFGSLMKEVVNLKVQIININLSYKSATCHSCKPLPVMQSRFSKPKQKFPYIETLYYLRSPINRNERKI